MYKEKFIIYEYKNKVVLILIKLVAVNLNSCLLFI
jgi:hypothetical protein